MKLGIITSQTDVARAVWLALPTRVRVPLAVAHPHYPEDTTLGEIRQQLERRGR